MVSVEVLLQQLTLDEKISLLAGANFWETVPIPRLGIPALKVSDGPNGARGASLSKGGATAACFPAAVAVAATFDNSIARRLGKALAEETKSKGASVLLGPTVCNHRSPRGGRNFESFSEDPLLAGNLATNLIQGLQEQGVGATIKHYACNEIETRRHFVDVNVDERTLREIYLKPFEIAIKAAKPWAVMTSYNLVNGVHADMSQFLLRKVLRDEWRFEGLVMSDWGGTNSVSDSITAGLDLEMPGPPTRRKLDAVKTALKSGALKPEAVNTAVTNVLKLLVKAGKFDNPEIPAEKSIISPEHSKLIRETASHGIVLLKNARNILPLSKSKLKSVAAVGLAKDCLAHGGGSAMVNCHYRVTAWEALENLFQGNVELKYAKGAQTFRNLADFTENIFDLSGKAGFTLSKFNNRDFNSTPRSVENIGSATYYTMAESVPALKFEAEYRPTKSGSHHLALNALSPAKLFVNNQLMLSIEVCTDRMGVIFGGAEEETCQFNFQGGETYLIRLESTAEVEVANGGFLAGGVIGTRLGWMSQQEHEADLLSEAVEAAKDVDVVLAFVGNSSLWETEGRDQPNMNLPSSGSQDRLITALAAVNPNVIVINSTGCPIAMPWLAKVPAIIQSWFGGQEAGNSIVDVLFGAVNPSGKLPVSFPKSDEDSASYGNFPGDLQTDQVTYQEGIKVGYRFFDSYPEKVSFPFGFGLSYTEFEICDVTVLQQADEIFVKANVRNVGARDGSQVVQVYISSPVKTVDMPVKELAAYAKVAVAAGGKEELDLQIGAAKLAYWDVKSAKWLVEKGEYGVWVGDSSSSVSEVGTFVVENSWSFDP